MTTSINSVGKAPKPQPYNQFLTTLYQLLKLFLPSKLSLKIQKLRRTLMVTTQRSVPIGFITVTVIMMLLGCSSSEGANTTPQEKLNTSVTTSPPSEITETVDTVDSIVGKKVLYIGHSFGRPFARELPSFVEMAALNCKKSRTW